MLGLGCLHGFKHSCIDAFVITPATPISGTRAGCQIPWELDELLVDVLLKEFYHFYL